LQFSLQVAIRKLLDTPSSFSCNSLGESAGQIFDKHHTAPTKYYLLQSQNKLNPTDF